MGLFEDAEAERARDAARQARDDHAQAMHNARVREEQLAAIAEFLDAMSKLRVRPSKAEIRHVYRSSGRDPVDMNVSYFPSLKVVGFKVGGYVVSPDGQVWSGSSGADKRRDVRPVELPALVGRDDQGWRFRQLLLDEVKRHMGG